METHDPNPARKDLTAPSQTNSLQSQTGTEELCRQKLENLRVDRRRTIMLAMWQRMSDYLGPKWERAYKGAEGSAFAAWSRALEHHDEDDIASAIISMQAWEAFDPPTLPQFLAMVVAMERNRKPNVTSERLAHEREVEAGNIIEHLQAHALSPVAVRELDRMKRILAGEEIETKEQSMHKLGMRARWPDARAARK